MIALSNNGITQMLEKIPALAAKASELDAFANPTNGQTNGKELREGMRKLASAMLRNEFSFDRLDKTGEVNSTNVAGLSSYRDHESSAADVRRFNSDNASVEKQILQDDGSRAEVFVARSGNGQERIEVTPVVAAQIRAFNPDGDAVYATQKPMKLTRPLAENRIGFSTARAA